MGAAARPEFRRWRPLLVALVSIGAVVFAWTRFRGNDTARDSALAAIEQVVETFGSVPTRPFEDISRDRIDQLVAGLPVDGDQLDERRRGKLNRIVSEFLFWRFLQSRPAEYRRWRQERGYSMTPASVFVEDWRLSSYYERVVGQPMPKDATIESLFDELWSREVKTSGGIYTPRGMGTDASGMAFAFGTMSSHQPKVRPRVRGVQGGDAWYTGGIGTHRNWFEPGFPKTSLVGNPVKYEVTEVGFVLSFESGGQRPLTLVLFWDPRSDDWVIGGLCVSAMRPEEPVALIEY